MKLGGVVLGVGRLDVIGIVRDSAIGIVRPTQSNVLFKHFRSLKRVGGVVVQVKKVETELLVLVGCIGRFLVWSISLKNKFYPY